MAKQIGRKRTLGLHFLREWREYRGDPSLEEIGEKLNASSASLSRIENRKQPYSQKLLEGLAEIYECEPSDLLRINPLVPRAVEILVAYREASPERKEIFHEILSGARQAAQRS